MDSSDPVIRSVLNAVILLLIIYIIAVPFYMYVEGFTLVESVYFVSVTIATVGYGDIVPKTTVGRIFTIGLMFSGVSIFFYHVTHLGQIRERSIDPYVQKRLQVLRNLTALHSGDIEKTELKKIRNRMEQSELIMESSDSKKERGKNDDRPRNFGRL